MKKKMILVSLVTFFFQLHFVDASVSASIAVSTTSTIVGNSGSATITVASNEVLGQIYGTFSCGSLGSKDLTYVNSTGENATSKSFTISWTAKSAGTYTCSVSGLQVGSLVHPEKGVYDVSAGSKTITVVNGSSGNSSGGTTNSNKGGTTAEAKEYSSDNNLSSLSIDGYELTPSFNQDTTEYQLRVDESVDKIQVAAKASDSKASISGTGEISLSSGENTIEVKVTAENGNEKVYKVIVTVEDQNPIKVKIGKDEFTVVKKNNNLIDKLDYYDEEVIQIDQQDVVAYTNSITHVTLVLLKDQKNKIGYYIYNQQNNSYTKYSYIKVSSVTLQLLDSNEKMENFKKYSIVIGEENTTIYKVKKSHKVGLIYGTNVKTGNTGYYVYDQNEGTLSKYYDEEVKLYQNDIKELKGYLMIFMGIISFVMIVMIVISLYQSKKRRKKKYSKGM